jgi:DNA-binding transcriptional regulator YdaS (Cro superfamily)
MALKVMNQALEKAVALVGGQTALAKLIGVKQQNVWQWLYDTGKPMSEYCIAIERATYGRVTRYELRPDVFGDLPQDPMQEEREENPSARRPRHD